MKKSIILLIFCLLAARASAQIQPYRVACVGNSITDGGHSADAYPQQLDVLLGDEYDVRNFGVSGTTMLKNGDMPYWEEVSFQNALDFDPDIVIILLGTNDSKPQNWAYGDEFFTDYCDMVDAFRQSGDPEIFAGRCPAVFQTLAGINNDTVRNEIIPLIDSVMTEKSTFTIDFYNDMLSMGNLFPDGVHPNADGYGVMANLAMDAILNMPAGVIRRFSAFPEIVEQGQSSMLRWETTVGSAVTLNTTPVEEADSLLVSPLQTTEYILEASGAVTNTKTIQVTYLPSGTIISFYARRGRLELGAGDSTSLVWETTGGSSVTLDGNSVSPSDSILVQPDRTTMYTLITEGDISDTARVTIELLDAALFNRALGQDCDASSAAGGFPPDSAFDGNLDTSWKSSGHNTEWIYVDLGRMVHINRVFVQWGETHASTWHIQMLDDGGATFTVFSTTTGEAGDQDLTGLSAFGRYVRLLCIKNSSTTEGYNVRELSVFGTNAETGVGAITGKQAKSFLFIDNYPNPFNPSTTIDFSIPDPGKCYLSIYNMLGQRIRTIIDEVMEAGLHRVHWDGRYGAGEPVPAGVYIARLHFEGHVVKRKMVLVR